MKLISGAMGLAGIAGLAAASTGMAQTTSHATATNVDGSNIANAAIVVTGNLDASGNAAAVLGPETIFATYARQQRVGGSINSFPLVGLPVGGVFRSTMRLSTNPGGGLDPGWDSIMRIRNSTNTTTLAFDDDSGPGPGRLSSIVTPITVPANGEATVQVTGFGDASFTGANTSNVGFYDLDVLQRTILTPATYGTNVQWWKFSNLTPGGAFSAESIAATLTQGTGVGTDDTILAAFDSSAALLGFDDDNGVDSLSRLTGTVPLDGTVYIAVTAYQGGSPFGPSAAGTYNNANNNGSSGSFQLQFIPAPTSAALLGLGGLAFARRRRN